MEEQNSEFWVFEPGVAYESKPNAILEKSFAFAIRIIRLHKWLLSKHIDIAPLAKQILRSGTAIGANAEEADVAYTKKEFASKLGISLKEAKETRYWLRLLEATDYIDEAMFSSLNADNNELMRLLISILKTTKENL
ncbi:MULTISPECIES: four helix bundle protein [unclassified Spirosoma]|uniref:four helix bundle protein n=1 Tax=unclassified Spirosoma TaxID=2621999 RepID=UPI00096136D3|nr:MULTISPECIES: four helix bundle protein [unclassified Spirosoma]MBN8822754.1 four helix bundle protein [Spirosoma sp.]OJW79964.1 MAG: four helix bundle protein [Spirosoma sp. 48-14]